MNAYSEELRNYNGSLSDYLREKGLSFKELVDACGLNQPYTVQDDTYIHFRDGRHQIVKRLNGRKVICGSFKSVVTARKYRDYLVENEWSLGAIRFVREKSESSMYRGTVGVHRVSKCKSANAKQGFYYLYQYVDEDGKRKTLSSVDLAKLEKKVKDNGLEWRRVDEF